MAMYLNRVPVYTIMLLGRWSSDAFLRYIRPQVEQFSSGVAQAMIKTGHMHHVPTGRLSQENPTTRNLRHHLAYVDTQGDPSTRTSPVSVNAFQIWT
jgi:hypothetical protein